MRGRDVCHASLRTATLPFRYAEPFTIYRDGFAANSGAQQGSACTHVPGILHPGGVAWIEQHSGREVEGLLRACRDDHLVQRTMHPTGRAQIVGDGLP